MGAVLDGSTRLLGVLGDPIEQVRAPLAWSALFRRNGVNAACVPLHVRSADLKLVFGGLRAASNVKGFIATIPHKPAMLDLVDEASPRARLVGAVNVVAFDTQRRARGDILDGQGLVESLRERGQRLEGRRALIVGSGGVGSAIAFALVGGGRAPDRRFRHRRPACRAAGGAPRVSRPRRARRRARPHDFDLVVNATPLGMRADDPLPFAVERLDPAAIVADVVIQSAPTRLLKAALARGCFVHPGELHVRRPGHHHGRVLRLRPWRLEPSIANSDLNGMISTMLRLTTPLDVERIRADFPIFQRQVNGHRLVYLDNASSTQKPRQVIDALVDFYTRINANVHRGVHTLSVEATDAYEQARERIGQFIGTHDPDEVVFVRNTTEGLNLVAACWGRANLREGDEILATTLEHHSNLVPWQRVAQETGARIRLARLTPDGTLDMEHFYELLNPRTRIVAIASASNVLGTLTPVTEIAERAHALGAIVVVDGAQSVPNMPTDVATSAPTSWRSRGTRCSDRWASACSGEAGAPRSDAPVPGRRRHDPRGLRRSLTWTRYPRSLTPVRRQFADGIGLAAAVDYLDALGMENVRAHE